MCWNTHISQKSTEIGKICVPDIVFHGHFSWCWPLLWTPGGFCLHTSRTSAAHNAQCNSHFHTLFINVPKILYALKPTALSIKKSELCRIQRLFWNYAHVYEMTTCTNWWYKILNFVLQNLASFQFFIRLSANETKKFIGLRRTISGVMNLLIFHIC